MLEESGELNDALFNYRKALTLGGDNPDILNNVGNVLRKQSLYAEAIQVFHDIIKNYPEDPAAYLNLGTVLTLQGEPGAALPYLNRAVQLEQEKSEAHSSLGNTLIALGDANSAITSIKRALQINPESMEAHNNMGCAWHYLGRYEDAREHYQRAIEIQAEYADAIFNLSLIKLLQGDLIQGWADYEYGLLTNNRNAPELPFKRWSGVSIPEHTVLVYSEQGVGDEVMFASCLPDLIEACPHIILACNRRLHALFSRSFPEITVIDGFREADELESWLPRLPVIDEYIPAGSLPKYFRPDMASFPRQQLYLVPDKARVGRWRDRYKALGPGLKVGISWKGGNKPHIRALRSIALTQWREIFAVAGAQFINLQYGDCQAELAGIQLEYGVTVHDWTDADPLKDLDDFSAQVAALDLVISVDNTSVHMAGALGVPVWVLLPSNPEWRWMLDREDSPWYSSICLFRQPAPGDWDSVIKQVTGKLESLIS